jgi:SAM-dependent methyltransferase
MAQTAEDQRRLILGQFTRQAVPFSQFPAHSTEESIRLVREAAGIGPDDTILDVACGPGLLACAFAGIARHVTGIDLTPAMIEQAEALQRAKGLDNLSWRVGDVTSLPFPDASFSVVFTRYSFHHILDPKAVLAEMVRACAPGGRVIVVDVYTTTPAQAEAYVRVERLRDPSHVRALRLDELAGLYHDLGMNHPTTVFYGLEVGLDALLASSFPEPGASDEIRRTFAADVGINRLGVNARLEAGEIRFAFPTVILVGRKPNFGTGESEK